MSNPELMLLAMIVGAATAIIVNADLSQILEQR
jgi:hypothetical protein